MTYEYGIIIPATSKNNNWNTFEECDLYDSIKSLQVANLDVDKKKLNYTFMLILMMIFFKINVYLVFHMTMK